MVSLEDLMYYRDKVLDDSVAWDFIGWELPSGQVILVHPWVTVFNSSSQIPLFPGQTCCIQSVWQDNVKNYEPSSCMKPKNCSWWKFW